MPKCFKLLLTNRVSTLWWVTLPGVKIGKRFLTQILRFRHLLTCLSRFQLQPMLVKQLLRLLLVFEISKHQLLSIHLIVCHMLNTCTEKYLMSLMEIFLLYELTSTSPISSSSEEQKSPAKGPEQLRTKQETEKSEYDCHKN